MIGCATLILLGINNWFEQLKTTPEGTGFWNIEVSVAGEYRIELRRWPKEADAG